MAEPPETESERERKRAQDGMRTQIGESGHNKQWGFLISVLHGTGHGTASGGVSNQRRKNWLIFFLCFICSLVL